MIGKVLGKLVGIELLTSQAGNPYFRMEFECGEFGSKLNAHYIASMKDDRAIKRTRDVLRMLGWTGTDPTDFLEPEGDMHGCTQEVLLTLEEETYNGETRTKVRFVDPVGQRFDESAMAILRAKFLA